MARWINLRLVLIFVGMLLASAVAGVVIGRIGAPAGSLQAQDWQPPRPSAAASATAQPSIAPRATASPGPTATTQASPRPSSPPTLEPTAEPSIAPTPAASDAPQVTFYTVQRGDILNRIARQFATTPDAIVALNPGINPESLTVGQQLRIPTD